MLNCITIVIVISIIDIVIITVIAATVIYCLPCGCSRGGKHINAINMQSRRLVRSRLLCRDGSGGGYWALYAACD